MTRTEFDEISTFWELRDFCAENDLYEITDEYIDGDDLDDCVWDDIRDWDGSWEDLGSCLYGIDRGYDFYYREGTLYYTGCSNDSETFYDMKREAYERAEEENLFEPEDEEDEEDDDSEVEESAELENLWFGVKEAV